LVGKGMWVWADIGKGYMGVQEDTKSVHQPTNQPD